MNRLVWLNQIFKKFTLKFNKLKIGDNWPISVIFTGIVRTFCTVYKVWRSQVFTSWCGKIQTDFLFSKIAVFLMYTEIYPYFCDYQTAYIAYWRLYCVQKWNNIDSNSILRGIAGYEWNHMEWFSQSQQLCSKLRNDVLDSVTQSACVVYSLSLCVCMVVPSHHAWMIETNDEKRWRQSSMQCTYCHFCKLKEYELITLIYNRKPCRLDLLTFWPPEDIIL